MMKCASLKMALGEKRIDRWRICVRMGPNGQGGDYIPEKPLLGEYSIPMGGVNVTSVDTFRLDGSQMRDAVELRVQEYPNRQTLGTIFKKMTTNESPERCGKYANARDYFGGEKLKTMDGNPEDLPEIKSCRSFESDNITGAIGRRIIRNIRKPKFFRDRDGEKANGLFLEINRDGLGDFLTDPYTAYIMWDEVLFRFSGSAETLGSTTGLAT